MDRSPPPPKKKLDIAVVKSALRKSSLKFPERIVNFSNKDSALCFNRGVLGHYRWLCYTGRCGLIKPKLRFYDREKNWGSVTKNYI